MIIKLKNRINGKFVNNNIFITYTHICNRLLLLITFQFSEKIEEKMNFQICRNLLVNNYTFKNSYYISSIMIIILFSYDIYNNLRTVVKTGTI